jgi:hypothetical protein
METGYPILIILTNKGCPHCIKLRGETGWPSAKLEPGFPPDKDGKHTRWDNSFFVKALSGGFDDNTQRARVIELFFEKLNFDSNLLEITFFDLENKGSSLKLVIKKYRSDLKHRTVLLKKNANGFVDVKEMSIKFSDFIDKYIPLALIRNYFHVFPAFLYCHSTIWDIAVREKASLYLRVQGFKTQRKRGNPKEYEILRLKSADIEEKNKNPIDCLRKLIAFNLEPLYYPSDH